MKSLRLRPEFVDALHAWRSERGERIVALQTLRAQGLGRFINDAVTFSDQISWRHFEKVNALATLIGFDADEVFQ